MWGMSYVSPARRKRCNFKKSTKTLFAPSTTAARFRENLIHGITRARVGSLLVLLAVIGTRGFPDVSHVTILRT
jgi:hypothetical protein